MLQNAVSLGTPVNNAIQKLSIIISSIKAQKVHQRHTLKII